MSTLPEKEPAAVAPALLPPTPTIGQRNGFLTSSSPAAYDHACTQLTIARERNNDLVAITCWSNVVLTLRKVANLIVLERRRKDALHLLDQVVNLEKADLQ